MPFADGAKAQNEPAAVFRRAGLVGVPHDARIEQGRRFERVLVKKIRADQAALRLVQYGMRLERLFHLGGARLEDLEQVPVTAFEILEHFGQLPRGSPGSSRRTLPTIWLARVLSVGLRSRGSVAGLKGLTTTLAGSGRRCKIWRFKNWD